MEVRHTRTEKSRKKTRSASHSGSMAALTSQAKVAGE